MLNKIVTAFSATLIHSLWQGIAFAIAIAFLLLLTKKWTAVARYNLVMMLFAGFLFISIVTFFWTLNTIGTDNAATSFSITLHEQVTQLFSGKLNYISQIINTINLFLSQHALAIATGWLIIFSIRMINVLMAFFYNERMKNIQVLPVTAYWKHTLKQLSSALQIRKTVSLLESVRIKMPVVIGHLKPVILLPIGLLASLPTEQTEAILLHELAHIRRNDYLINIFQHIAETIFFFNPAVLWMSAWLKEEREKCCDDLAIAQTQNKHGMIAALISFKQNELYGTFYQTAFPGRKNHLLRRVKHILGNNDNATTLPGKLFFLVSFILIIAGIGSIMLAENKASLNKKISVPINSSLPNTHHKVIAAAVLTAQQKSVTDKKVVRSKKSTAVVHVAAAESAPTNEAVAIERKKAFYEDQQKAKTAKYTGMTDEENALLAQKQSLNDQLQAKLNEEQAMKDQAKAKLDAEKAYSDQQMAELDQKKAYLDQQRTMQDNAASKSDQRRATADQQIAMKRKRDAEQAKLNQQLQ